MENNTKKVLLKQTLSLFDATAINIGAIIGAGIFVVTGIVAGLAGSGMLISLILAAVVSLFTALSFAELSAQLPKEGGAYEYAHRLVSPFSGFIAGWMWVISNTFVGAAVALGFGHYLAAMITGIPVRTIAIAITAVFGFLNIMGAKSSATVNNILVIAKIIILFIFVGLGSLHINENNLKPFDPLDPVLRLVVKAALKGISHVGFETIGAPMSQKVVLEHIHGMVLSSGIVIQDNRGQSGILPILINQV
jgi:basic amino acid/polyamine antiporter, APA family